MSELKQVIEDVREQLRFLGELGVETMSEPPELASDKLDGVRLPDAMSATTTSVARAIPAIQESSTKPRVSRLAALPTLSDRAVKVSRPGPLVNTAMPTDKQAVITPAMGETIPGIRAEIGKDCTRCKLSELGRTQVVMSTGNFSAELMFVGEAPGADEDIQGEPFVGRAGQLLTKIIEGIGMKREDVFIGNINRCRPPKNRAPEPDECSVCKPFLLREIAVVKPKAIVVLGATAAHNLLETKEPIGKMRGRFHEYAGTKVMPTFHPAYLLRDPHKKREVWEDMKLVRDYLNS